MREKKTREQNVIYEYFMLFHLHAFVLIKFIVSRWTIVCNKKQARV